MNTLNTTISILLFIIFLSLSAIHFYWGFGGRRLSDGVLPTKLGETTPTVMPGKIPTFIVAIGLLCFGLFYLVKAEIISLLLPSWLDRYGLWFIAGIFIFRAIGDFRYVGFFKKIKQTKFGMKDSKYYSPLCLMIGILTLIILRVCLNFVFG